MSRRELLDVAGALAGSFVSRNNDVDGYWSLGLLRSYADSSDGGPLRFNIVDASAQPEDDLLVHVAKVYQQMLVQQLNARRIATEVVAKAVVILTFVRNLSNAPPATTYGAPFLCTVRLTDRRDREFERTIVGHCAPHDPQRERRSMRAKE